MAHEISAELTHWPPQKGSGWYIGVDLSGVAATELVQVVDLEDVGSTGASMSPVLSALELS